MHHYVRPARGAQPASYIKTKAEVRSLNASSAAGSRGVLKLGMRISQSMLWANRAARVWRLAAAMVRTTHGSMGPVCTPPLRRFQESCQLNFFAT